MGEEVEVLGCGIGRRGEVIGAGVWTAWLVVLCVVQTEHGMYCSTHAHFRFPAPPSR